MFKIKGGRPLLPIPTIGLFFITYLLSPHDYMFPATTAANVSQETKDELMDLIKLYDSKLNNQTLENCTESVTTMVGELPAEGEADLSGIYSNFVHAYHYSFPAITWWPEAHDEFHHSRKVIIRAREMQSVWKFIRECRVALQQFLDYINDPSKDGAASEEDDEYAAKEESIREQCINNEDVPPRLIATIDENVLISCFETMELVLVSFFGAGVSKKVAGLFEPPFDTSLFGRMDLDTSDADVEINKRLTSTFPDYIAKVRLENPQEADFLQIKLDEIKAKLTTPPFDEIYLDGDIDDLEDRKEDGWFDFNENMEDLYLEYGPIDQFSTLQENIEYWQGDLQYFVEDLNNGKFKLYYDKVVKFYNDWIKVDRIDKNDPNLSPETLMLLEYGEEWNWDSSNNIQGMRVAWNLVIAVLEEIKCYMKDTYFYDLRDEALRRTQRDLKNGSLYYGVSYTIFLPCRITNELDIVSDHCIAENNEICGPMGPLDDLQRPGSKLHGQFDMLRPKWIYKYDPVQRTCVGRKDYVSQIYHCRCGFRMDCGDDLGENITCQLQYNDLVRGQCRGGVGYPCKTLPLAPGKHDQTCKSGYCNMKKNSCEDAPYYPKFVAGANVIRLSLNLFQVAVWHAAVLEFRGLK